MANEFEAGICSEIWWNNNNNNQSRIPLETAAYSAVLLSDIGSFRWSAADMALLMDMKTPARSTSDDNDVDDQSAFVCENSIMGFQKSHQDDSDWMLGFGPSSATSEWNNPMLFEGTERNESNYNSMVQEDIPSSSFLMESASTHIYPSSTSTVRSLFETQQQQQQQPSVFDSYQSSPKCETKQQSAYHLQYSNNTPFWHAALAAEAVDNEIQTRFLSSHHSTYEEKASCTTKLKTELQDSIVMKSSSEHAFKRPRIESPLPTFKVRKEKLGDRVTALQQLVSPFGKNDTASVLHEAIDYIKFLHDQVNVLSTPSMKNGAHTVQRQQISNKVNDSEGTKNDLRSKGLCLVPISSTYSVANETAADFWAPNFTGNIM